MRVTLLSKLRLLSVSLDEETLASWDHSAMLEILNDEITLTSYRNTGRLSRKRTLLSPMSWEESRVSQEVVQQSCWITALWLPKVCVSVWMMSAPRAQNLNSLLGFKLHHSCYKIKADFLGHLLTHNPAVLIISYCEVKWKLCSLWREHEW